jgi:nucleoside 2-deoxyribosyltransferase
MKKKLTIYCAHPITGLSYEKVHKYYTEIVSHLESAGFNVLHPMTAKAYLHKEKEFKAGGYQHPASTNHAIKERDQWMVRTCDVVLVDFTGAKTVSIGCVGELSWGDILGKHTVVVMEENNIHRHAFTDEEADIIFTNLDDAKAYLQKLISNEI